MEIYHRLLSNKKRSEKNFSKLLTVFPWFIGKISRIS
ncbi:MAG: hypothetical protein MRERV_3c028 [Mycoplasmataceae bacterium RV_VA103A]|nr:MAG: hypothetical protein MRERV_3c028 [Mycoplasmataceae bacterium RV_VA103A]